VFEFLVADYTKIRNKGALAAGNDIGQPKTNNQQKVKNEQQSNKSAHSH